MRHLIRRFLLLFLFPQALFVVGAAVAVGAVEDGKLYDLLIMPEPGERFQHVEFSCWIPDAATPLQGVLIHQHGCTNASPESHPPVTLDFHWRAHHEQSLGKQEEKEESANEV
ncbi:MAG: hypothetical protein ABL994_05030, partial [Verrucomicrobiales bacterium]